MRETHITQKGEHSTSYVGSLFMRCNNIIIPVLMFLVIDSTGAENDLRFWHLNNTNGLSGTVVNSILQDTKGFIWIGTDYGLNRYDSRSFALFTSNANDSFSISGNKVNKIIEDHDGTIWLATDGGLCSFNSRSGKSTRFFVTDNKQTTNTVNEIFEDDTGRLWIGTGNSGWGIFDRKTGRYIREKFEHQVSQKDSLRGIYNIYSIAGDRNGTLYFGSLSYSLIVKRNDQYSFTHSEDHSFPFPAHTINTIFCDHVNNTWIGAWDNVLHKYDPQHNMIEHIFIDGTDKIAFSGNEITCINEDENGILWIGTTRQGLFLVNPATRSVKNYVHERNNDKSISENNIRCIYRDHESRMWIGTSRGVDIFDPLLNQFEVHYLPSGTDERVNDFLESNDNFLIATSGGLLRVDPASKQMVQKTFSYQGERPSFTKLFKDSYGNIYAGTDKTVFSLDEKNFSIHPFRTCYNRIENAVFDFYNIPSSRIVSMAQGKWLNRDVLWISPYGHGLAAFDLKTKTGFVTSLFGDGEFEHLINKIYVDSRGNIYCLTANHGITRNFSSTQSVDSIFHLPLSNEKTVLCQFHIPETAFLNKSISNLPANVYDMLEYADGSFWITSSGSGLYKLDLVDTLGLIHYGNNFQNMYGLKQDANRNLWIISSAGIEFFNTDKNVFTHFSETDGIPNEGLTGYFYKDKDGYLYAGGKGYYLKFKPENIRLITGIPKAAITHFRIFDQPSDSLMSLPAIELSYQQNYFSFEFAALSFTNADQNSFAYMLEGFDENWIQSGKRNYAGYTSLKGGHYLFKMKAANSNHVWSDEITIPIYIKPPLWQFAWFWPAIILITGGIIFLVYRNRINQRHKLQTAKLLAEIDVQEKERHRIARDLHDEFGTKISAFKIYLNTFEKYIENRTPEVENTRNELHAVVDESLTELRNLLMDLSPKLLDMHGFSAAVRELVDRLNKMQLFVITVYIKPELKRFDKKYELILYRIVQELLNNSIKHAACTEINLQLFYREEKLVLNYDDNGKGFQVEEKMQTGYGLSNVQTRASLLNGSVSWESKPGYGLNVIVEIPFTLN